MVGIDVGYSPTRRSSAVCRLDWDTTTLRWRIERFRAIEPERASTIAEVVGSETLLAVSLDGPLRRGLDVIGEYRILRILSEASEPLYSSDIAARLNRELREWRAYSPVDVVKCMQAMGGRVVQLSDGRWTLKRRMD